MEGSILLYISIDCVSHVCQKKKRKQKEGGGGGGGVQKACKIAYVQNGRPQG